MAREIDEAFIEAAVERYQRLDGLLAEFDKAVPAGEGTGSSPDGPGEGGGGGGGPGAPPHRPGRRAAPGRRRLPRGRGRRAPPARGGGLMDLLDRVYPVARELLDRVDATLLAGGAPADHPIWPLLRRLGALPGEVVAHLAGGAPGGLTETGDTLRQHADGYRHRVDAVPTPAA